MTKSHLEESLWEQIAAYGIELPECEYKFHPKRKWRFDMAWVDRKLAVEIQGGSWIHGSRSHAGGTGMTKDCEKNNSAIELGWRVLKFTSDMIQSDYAIKTIQNILEKDF